jgi:capsule biosynthesis phosphatase
VNIVIPLGGLGKRFSEFGYRLPKPLIRLFFKPIIFWLLDNLSIRENDKVYLICNKSLKKYRFEDEIKKKYPNYNIIYLDADTRGAAETIFKGTKDIEHDAETILLDGDTFYGIDLLATYRMSKQKNMVVCFKQSDERPVYSYVGFDESKIINKIAEKDRITEFANTGAYAFAKLSELRKYCKKIIDDDLRFGGEFYMSRVIAEMIKDKKKFVANVITESDFDVVGTPFQYKLFQNKFMQNKNLDYFKNYRICFDFDNTLVTYPKIPADYTSVEPIKENIEFARFLKKLGCTIIVYTARRMKTHSGNVGKITADVGKITIDTLENFEIPYDELYFGKPYAHTYIDDLVINAFDDYQKELGISNFSIDERDFNSLEDNTIPVITKRSEDANKLKGEIEWYLNLPRKLCNYAPSLISYDDANWSEYCVERILGLTFQELFLSESLTIDGFSKLLNVLKDIHSFKIKSKGNIYQNYTHKLIQRYKSYDYSKYDKHQEIYNQLQDELNEYTENKKGKRGIIHGDPVFSNILMDKFGKIKLIDPRGMVGRKSTIHGDIFYDYAKVYQSLLGYDEVMQSKSVSHEFRETFVSCLFDHVKKEHGDEYVGYIKTITNSLLFSLIPLHDNDKCNGYFNLIKLGELV